MLWDENMWGKYVGKIQGENMSRKYFGKICGETCRENMWGKIFHRFAGPNIKDDKYTSVLYCTQAEDFCRILRIELLSRDRMLQYLQAAARHSSAISLDR